jgi:hypothetical protein
MAGKPKELLETPLSISLNGEGDVQDMSVTKICDRHLFRAPMRIVAERSAIPGDTIQTDHLWDVARRNHMIATPETIVHSIAPLLLLNGGIYHLVCVPAIVSLAT